ncbi:MAG: hypothetical protein RhofKO_20370 [Rhodothermales bacterium]
MAQPTLNWQPRIDLNASLPGGVRVYEAENPSIPLRAWYVTIDTSTVMLDAVLASGGGAPLTTLAAQSDAVVAINSGYFGGGQSFSFVASGGVVLSPNIAALTRPAGRYFPTRGAFGLLADGMLDVAWIYQVSGMTYTYPRPNPNTEQTPASVPTLTSPSTAIPWNAVTGVGGGPVLLSDGQIRITWEEEVFFGSGIGSVSDRQPRSAIGYTARGDVILMVVDGRQNRSQGVSLTDLAGLMRSVGAVEALNLDGGGSSTLTVGTTLLNRPEGGTAQRAIQSAFVVRERALDPGAGDARVYDTGDGCCYRETGDWSESANPPFYGGTPARLHPIGATDATATFAFPDLPSDTYEVEAWWVPARNRALDTPYRVYHQGEMQEIRVDQSDVRNAGRWVTLGTFELAAGDSVVVANDAFGDASAFVCVDALRLSALAGTRRVPRKVAREPVVEVYPNPASHMLAVTLMSDAAHGPMQVEIYNMLGQQVLNQTWSAHQAEARFDVQGLASGLYHVRVEVADGHVQYQRFAIIR